MENKKRFKKLRGDKMSIDIKNTLKILENILKLLAKLNSNSRIFILLSNAVHLMEAIVIDNNTAITKRIINILISLISPSNTSR